MHNTAQQLLFSEEWIFLVLIWKRRKLSMATPERKEHISRLVDFFVALFSCCSGPNTRQVEVKRLKYLRLDNPASPVSLPQLKT
jgi:hypothetical protein